MKVDFNQQKQPPPGAVYQKVRNVWCVPEHTDSKCQVYNGLDLAKWQLDHGDLDGAERTINLWKSQNM